MTATLASFFDDVAAGKGLGPPVDRAALDEVRDHLRSELEEIGARLPPDAPQLVLTKRRVRDVLACETGALTANEVVTDLGPSLVLGQLVDRLVGTYVVTGAVPEDTFASAVESLRAERNERTLAWLDAVTPETIAGLREDLDDRAARVQDTWPAVLAEWWPRPEDAARIPFAGGRIELSGRFDLLLGGRATDLPRLIVEVKAGSATGVHQPDLYWYALLAALRDGAAPRCVAVWSAGDGITTTAPISVDGLRSAALRVIDAADRWVALLAGKSPSVTAHPGCRWCALLDVCETGQRWQPADG